MENANQQDIRFDILRVGSAFAVVWLHTSATVVTTNPSLSSLQWWLGNLADGYSRWCVPIFVMVSGALLLSQPSKEDPLAFYRRRARRLMPALLFWTLFYIAWHSYRAGQVDLFAITKSVVAGQPYYHLWYLYMLIGLYIVTPFLRQFIENASDRLFVLAIIASFVIGSVETLIKIFTAAPPGSFFGLWPAYVGYFLAGYYLSRPSGNVPSGRILLWIFLGCGALIALITGLLFTQLGARAWELAYSYLDPLVITMSLFIFRYVVYRPQIVNTASIDRFVRAIAPLSFGIYLLHPFWLDILSDYGINGFMFQAALGIPFTALLAFGLSAVCAGILRSLPLISSTVR